MTSRLGEFWLHGELGRGSFGIVYRGQHEPSGLWAAVKTLPVKRWQDRAFFHNEVRTLAAVSHRNVLAIHAYGVDGDIGWMATELASHTLAESEALAGGGRLQFAREALQALAHLHARGILHRDIKPNNLLISPTGTLRIGDFGVASMGRDLGLGVAGTESFMAPEQRSGSRSEQGPWTDLFALSRTLASTGDAASGPMSEWLAWLAAPDPGQRPHCAAAALAALPQQDGEWTPRPSAAPTARTAVGVATGPAPALAPSAWAPVSPPDDWRGSRRRTPPLVEGAWLLRSDPPLVGRSVEQDQLWRALITASEPAVVTLHGERGVGRSALARWLATRACEVGVAVLRVGTDQPADVVREWIGPAAESREALCRYLVRRGVDVLWAGPIGAMLGLGGEPAPLPAVFAALIDAQVGRALVVVDGVDERGSVLPALLSAREMGARASVLWVDGGSSDEQVAVPPLEGAVLDQAIRAMAPAGPALRHDLVATFGADLDAMQRALRRADTRGVLHMHDGELRLDADAALAVSDTVPPVAEQLLALLGEVVDDTVWSAACADAGVAADALTDSPDVERQAGGWRWRSAWRRRVAADAAPATLCALALQYRAQDDVLWDAELQRRSGDVAGAVDRLWRALAGKHTHSMGRTLSLHRRLLAWMPEEDPRWVALVVRMAGLSSDSGDRAGAAALLERVEPSALTGELRRRVVHIHAVAELLAGRPQDALDRLMDHPQTEGAEDHAYWLSDVCAALFALGRYEEVVARVEALREVTDSELARFAGEASLYRGDIDAAERWLEVAELTALPRALAYVVQLRAACRQMRGDLAGAEEGYLRAAAVGLGQVVWLQAMTNAALVAALRGRDDIALARAEDVLPYLRKRDWKQNIAYAVAILAATVPDLEVAAHMEAEARALVQALGLCDPDLDALFVRAEQRQSGATAGA